jgi:hypothetical protein
MVRSIEEVVLSATIAEPDTLTLLAAHHSRLGDALSLLAGDDGRTTAISPGDTVTMEFAAPAVPSGHVRDLFLLSNGVYTTVGGAGSATAVVWRNALGAPRPNPSVGSVAFSLTAAGGPVSIRVYDVAGRLVRSLVDAPLAAGSHELTWTLTNEQGRRVSPGVYFCRMVTGDWRTQRKVVVLSP